ncbi:FAD/NAD(P)-binding domain-containing protein [Trametes cingulata]|nr:FAD/NAD(P)-binding domain-containing protein [Trametes cingulata]
MAPSTPSTSVSAQPAASASTSATSTSTSTCTKAEGQPLRTVAVLGASYGGARAAHILAHGLPPHWRVVLVDRNSHMNHLYVLPRYAVLPGHEHKAFIPYDNVFQPPPKTEPVDVSRHVLLHANVLELREHELTLDRAFPEHGVPARTLRFDYLVYALGSHLPAPINLWGPVADEELEQHGVVDIVRGTKEGGVAWLKKFQKRVERASSVLVVGGGALGIQYATDIAEIYPATRVTLLHSRHRLLPRFDEGMHTEILSTLSALNVCTILGDRLDLASLAAKSARDGAERVVRTQSGREVRAELVLLCTGQTPNTGLLRAAFPRAVVPDGPNKGMARVRRTMQLAELVDDDDDGADLPAHKHKAASTAVQQQQQQDQAEESPVESSRVERQDEREAEAAAPAVEAAEAAEEDAGAGEEEAEEEEEPEPEPVEEDPRTRVAAEHIFAIGDAADAFGAVNAGHNAFFQGEVAARNILKLIKREEREAAKAQPASKPQAEQEPAPATDVASENPEPAPQAPASEEGADEEDLELEKYVPGAPAIKVSLGLTKSVYQFQGMIGTRDKEPADLDVHLIWRYFGHRVDREDLEREAQDDKAQSQRERERERMQEKGAVAASA